MNLKRIILAAAIGLQLATGAAAQTVYSTPYIGDRVIYVDTVADMLALPAGKSLNGQVVVTKRYSASHTVGDGSGNAYRSDTSEGGTPDGGFIIDDTGTHWHAVDKSVANVMQFGATDNSTTDDDTAAIQAACDAVSPGGRVVIQAGTFFLSSAAIDVPTDVHIVGAGEGETILLRGDTSAAQEIFRIKTYGANTATYESDKKNIRISGMTLDWNFSGGWENYAPCIGIYSSDTSNSDTLENIEIDHITFQDSAGATPTGGPDAWGVNYQAHGPNNSKLYMHHCKSITEWHQLFAGGGRGWDDVWIYANHVYHCRDNGITCSTTYDESDGTYASFSNIHIYENHITGFANYGIWVGADASSRCRGARYQNVYIHDNVITADSWKETGVAQAGIGLSVPENGVDGLVISGNIIRKQSDNTAATYRAIRIAPYENVPSLTLNASFTQPAVDATVAIDLGTDDTLLPGAILHMGDGTDAGGRYQITSNDGSGDYTVTRLTWPVGTTAASTVPVTVNVEAIGECRDLVLSGNQTNAEINIEYVVNGQIEKNTCDKTTLTQAAIFQDCIRTRIADNQFGDVVWIYYNADMALIDNTFDVAATSAGWFQAKANPDELGRQPHSEVYISGNHGYATPNKIIAQTTTGSGTHALRGDLYVTGTPESAVIADVGTVAYRVNGGASTTLYVKESGTGNTGWVAK